MSFIAPEWTAALHKLENSEYGPVPTTLIDFYLAQSDGHDNLRIVLDFGLPIIANVWSQVIPAVLALKSLIPLFSEQTRPLNLALDM